jgi:BASS family bile acid:Na+ symporter
VAADAEGNLAVQLLITLLVFITLAEMMFVIGLRLGFSQMVDSLRGAPWLVFRAMVTNYAFIPFITILFILLFKAEPMAATGLLILGVTPAAPYGPPFTLIARGNLAIATGLMSLLALSSAFMAPLLLWWLQPFIASVNLSLIIDPVKLIGNLFFIQLIPLFIGLSFNQWHPALAKRLLNPSQILSKILNGLMMTAIFILQFRTLSGINPSVIILMVVLIIAGVVCGWLMGWPGKENRIAVSIITGMRNMGLSIGIATMSFPGSAVVSTVIAYSFVAGVGLLGYAFLIRKFVLRNS